MANDTLSEWLFNNDKTIAKSFVTGIVLQCKKFKIGKTGEKLEDRKNQPDYKDAYDNIDEVYQTSSKDEASAMEAFLIDEYEHLEKCQNKKDGDHSLNDEMADSDTYYVYIVWK